METGPQEQQPRLNKIKLLEAALKRIKSEINDVVAELKTVPGIVKGRGLPTDDEQQALARVEYAVARLEGARDEELPQDYVFEEEPQP